MPAHYIEKAIKRALIVFIILRCKKNYSEHHRIQKVVLPHQINHKRVLVHRTDWMLELYQSNHRSELIIVSYHVLRNHYRPIRNRKDAFCSLCVIWRRILDDQIFRAANPNILIELPIAKYSPVVFFQQRPQHPFLQSKLRGQLQSKADSIQKVRFADNRIEHLLFVARL